jgi:aspartyl-tRNA(Asn)/glutamyl-tRNA(Gln) amidotransferase subunit A
MSSVQHLARALGRADHPSAQHVFLHRDDAQLYDLARAFDNRAAHGQETGPLSGQVIVIKGNIDVLGLTNTAGSRQFSAPPAPRNAPLVRRILDSGGLPLGHANMSEFAFSGLGLNPHFGTPVNALAPDLVPGGSSSGCASAIALGIADMAVGTDTSGSTRVPAACQGLCGFRPTMGRYQDGGTLPLAPSLDTPGPMARDMGHLLRLDAALRQDRIVETGTMLPRLIVPAPGTLGPLDPDIQDTFRRAVNQLSKAGFRITERALPALAQVRQLFRTHGSLVAVEAPQVLSALTDITSLLLDPVIRQRLEQARTIPEEAAAAIRSARAPLQQGIRDQLSGDLLLLPTLPAPPPRLRDVQQDPRRFAEENARILELTMLGAYLDMPSLALPCGLLPGQSLTLAGPSGDDDRVLWVGQQLERHLTPLTCKAPK